MTARWPHVSGPLPGRAGMNMWTPLLLITFAATPCAQQQQRPPACPVCPEQIQEIQEIQEILLQVSRDIDEEDTQAATRNVALREWLWLKETEAKEEFRASIEKLENATNHLVQELDIVRSRQAASAAVQASQVIMMVTYFLTIICTWGLSRSQKVSEKAKRKEFERLEMQLRSSKAKRRAAAAKEKSAPAQSLE